MRDKPIVSLGHIDISEPTEQSWNYDEDNLPVLPTRDFVMFPHVTFPIVLGRESSLHTALEAEKKHSTIGIFCQRNPETELPVLPDDIYRIGVLAHVIKVFELPDGNHTAILRSGGRVVAIEAGKTRNAVKAELLPEPDVDSGDKEIAVVADMVKETALSLFRKVENVPNELSMNLENIDNASLLINMVSTHVPFDSEEKFELLKEMTVLRRGKRLLKDLKEQAELLSIRESINERTRLNITEGQRQNFLQQQMETIRQELYGDTDDELTKFKERGDSTAFPDDVRAVFERELQKLSRYNPQSPDYAVQYSYLDLLLSLPWGKQSELNNDFNSASEILDSEHFGLEKVKERIIEQIAVMMNRPEGNNPIICLAGPPGVGKTSLGKSIAAALGREYQRVSLGGMHDEAEIRGHRRTYIGAMPGRIIDAVRRAGTTNPVLLLDEVDKIAADTRTNPEAALLEVLDPEQNCHFHDNYVDVDYDLSKVLFVATANNLSTISRPLLDRMEVIELSGYLLEEKIEIAKRHLIPRLLKSHGFPAKGLQFSDEAIKKIIESYTSESGVRQLEKNIAKIIRKSLVTKMSKGRTKRNITPEIVRSSLGVETFSPDRYEGNDYPGVVTGLAWTSVGGEILYVESSLSKSKAPRLTLTGNLGDVMKESAQIALEYTKAHADNFGIDPRVFEQYSLHIHVPEGAIPKDGPSAGITMVTSIVSAMTRLKVKPRVAMTGEITLRGRVLPVGGIKEKILAAKRAGIDTIILSEQNRKNIEDIEPEYVKGMKFVYVDNIEQVVAQALSDVTAGPELKLEENKEK
ncbi:MAG: endopeptidase La [Firmicutes bacterium]|nr:endopeptidase La [Bacillota bacterium]MCM1401396.1 endopeptidase La [Bacteroides sp.]MCM1477334.1 endopeptidase La [Bacteroides sp.]